MWNEDSPQPSRTPVSTSPPKSNKLAWATKKNCMIQFLLLNPVDWCSTAQPDTASMSPNHCVCAYYCSKMTKCSQEFYVTGYSSLSCITHYVMQKCSLVNLS